jgi:zinc/manganese transport system permease protein
VERVAPAVQTAFLTPYERGVVADSHEAIARSVRELERLRTLQAEVQWGTRDLPPEQRERLRQFLVARDELVTGDRLVLRTLTQRARQRQRFVLGVPLALAGAAAAATALRTGRRPLTGAARAAVG